VKLGLGSYTYTWWIGVPGYPPPASPLTAEGLLDEASSFGVAVVQLCDNIALDAIPDDALARLAARARGAGITLEAGTRGTDPDHLQRFIRIATALGARLLRTMVTGEIAEAEQDLRGVLGDLEKSGVVCAIENYERHSVWDLAAMIRRIASPFVGACLDTVNSLGALETPREAIEALLPLTASLHVKDFDLVRADHRMGFSVVGTPAGKGRLAIPDLVEAVRGNGRDPNAILELWTPFAGSVEGTIAREREWAAESIAVLRRYIQT
jgi:sugar phosphate isomerase/epimerase